MKKINTIIYEQAVKELEEVESQQRILERNLNEPKEKRNEKMIELKKQFLSERSDLYMLLRKHINYEDRGLYFVREPLKEAPHTGDGVKELKERLQSFSEDVEARKRANKRLTKGTPDAERNRIIHNREIVKHFDGIIKAMQYVLDIENNEQGRE